MTTAALPAGARVLIVRMGALGDIVHTLPVLAALAQARPDVTVDWLVESRHAAVLGLVEGVDTRVVVRATSPGHDAHERRFGGATGAVAAVRYLRAQRYEAAIDLQGLIKSAVFARASGARRVIGFVPEQLREGLAAWCYGETVAGPADGHVVQKNLATLAALGVAAPPRLAFRWVVRASAAAADVLSWPPIARAGRFALLNPGAAWPNKRWPAARFGELAHRLATEVGLPSVVTWGAAERALADEVVRHAGGQAMVSPATTLNDLLALSRQASLVVSGDTGPLHLAASVGAPIVGLFGPTRPERNGPWSADDESVSRAGTCVCFHKRECRRGRACVNDIPVDEVFAACQRRLATGRR